ncbi:alpha/beta fold hydrolase [Mycobacterium sp. BMJ-28]
MSTLARGCRGGTDLSDRSKRMPVEVQTATLNQGSIEYRDYGTSGPVVVLLHGALVDGRLWDPIIEHLAKSMRVVVPELPLGSHRIPMPPGSDLSVFGMVDLIGDLLEHLDLTDVTIVGNDTGSVYCQVIAVRRPERVAGIILTPGDMFEQFPPKAFFHLHVASKLPDIVVKALMWHVTLEGARYLPSNFGWMVKRRVPKEITDGWVLRALHDRDIMRDAKKVLGSFKSEVLLDNAPRLWSFAKPVLLIWASEDHFWKPAQAYRLAGMLPNARVEEVADAYTLVMWDQPERVAELISGFVETKINTQGARATSTVQE